MRSREFIMKDAYSFDLDVPAAKASYQVMAKAYRAIFDRFGLRYRAVAADSGAIALLDGSSRWHCRRTWLGCAGLAPGVW